MDSKQKGDIVRTGLIIAVFVLIALFAINELIGDSNKPSPQAEQRN